MKKLILVLLALVLLSGCSTAEPGKIGASTDEPVYMAITETTYYTANVTLDGTGTDMTGVLYADGSNITGTDILPELTIDGLNIKSNANRTRFLPEEGKFLKIGDATSQTHLDLGGNDDLFIAGNLEIGGDSWLQGTSYLVNPYINTATVNGTWVLNSGIWAIPAVTLNDTVTGGENIQGLLPDDQHVLDTEVITAVEAETDIELDGISLQNGITLNNKWFDKGTGSMGCYGTGATTGWYMRLDDDSVNGISNVWKHNSASPAINDLIFREFYRAENDLGGEKDYASKKVTIIDPTSGSEDGNIKWYLIENGDENLAMYLNSDGTLYTDLAPQVFDDYDDAILLKDGIKNGDYEKLFDAGVLVNVSDNSTPNYMISMQNMSFLLAGASYQNRDKIDALEKRIIELEKLLK